ALLQLRRRTEGAEVQKGVHGEAEEVATFAGSSGEHCCGGATPSVRRYPACLIDGQTAKTRAPLSLQYRVALWKAHDKGRTTNAARLARAPRETSDRPLGRRHAHRMRLA